MPLRDVSQRVTLVRENRIHGGEVFGMGHSLSSSELQKLRQSAESVPVPIYVEEGGYLGWYWYRGEPWEVQGGVEDLVILQNSIENSILREEVKEIDVTGREVKWVGGFLQKKRGKVQISIRDAQDPTKIHRLWERSEEPGPTKIRESRYRRFSLWWYQERYWWTPSDWKSSDVEVLGTEELDVRRAFLEETDEVEVRIPSASGHDYHFPAVTFSIAEFSRLEKEAAERPVELCSLKGVTYWWFKDAFYSDDEGASQEEVELLLWDRARKKDRKIDRIRQVRESSKDIQRAQREQIPADIQRLVWDRDGGRCVRCGVQQDLQFDHVIPVAKGGGVSVQNIQILCGICNRAKSDLIGE